ncbi:MAG TPA: diguanylate cyclase [Acidimicrobiales bacterium]
MRLRSLAVWLVAPTIVSLALTTWLVTRAIDAEREEAERLGRTALEAGTIEDAAAWISSEITNLLALDAFRDHDPGLEPYRAAADAAWESMSWDMLLDNLHTSDSEGAALLSRAQLADDLPPPVAYVLRPLPDSTMDAIADGETGMLDPRPYVDASRWAADRLADADRRSQEAAGRLMRFADRPTPWQSSTVLMLVISLALVGITGAVLVLWRLSTMSRSLTSRITAAESDASTLRARSDRYRHLIELARRLTAESDVHSLSHALVEETRRLLGGEVVSLTRRDGSIVRPAVVAGELPVTAVSTGEGVVGRTVDAGTATRTVVDRDPFVPGVGGPLAMMTAPLVVDGQVIGAIVVGARSATTFDENDAMALELLAFLAAGAMAAAQRYDSTVALALRDPLTGLANRRKLDLDLAKASATEVRVAFLMVDIDHFKSFNDRHGHQRGDALLRAVAHAISAAVRKDDCVYRYGGEEFSVLLPGADAATAGLVAERVRTAVRAATAGMDGDAITVSVGVAAQSAPIVASKLLAEADAALYAAKGTGRDRVVMHGAAFG